MRTVRDMAKNDEIWTPPEAVLPLIKYLPGKIEDEAFYFGRQRIYWEMCPGSGQLVDILSDEGLQVVTAINWNSLEKEPMAWDVIVTNPPWSQKHLFLERCMGLEKPFALLLPVRTLGVRRCQVLLYDIDVLFLARRVDFTGGGAPYEACAWFTRGLLPDRMVFEG